MAKTIFAVGKNRVVQIPDDVAPGRFTFKLDGWQGYRSLQSIITRVGVSKQCSAQLLHTLGDDTYIYTFGHRVGQITISGLAFTATCDGGRQTQLGAEHILTYYERNNLSDKQTPTKITIGANKTFQAYLAGVNVDVEDVPSGIWRFNFLFHEIPERKRKKQLKNGDLDPAAEAAGAAAGAAAGGSVAGGGGAITNQSPSGSVGTPPTYSSDSNYTATGTDANANGDTLNFGTVGGPEWWTPNEQLRMQEVTPFNQFLGGA